MRVLLLLSALLLSGCLHSATFYVEQVPLTASAPNQPSRPLVDVRASELTFDTNQTVQPSIAEQLRREFAEAIDTRFEIAAPMAVAKPARFRAHVTAEDTFIQTAYCLAILTYFGCPMGKSTAHVELELEVDGRRYQAKGKGEAFVSLYYNTISFNASSGRALAVAVDDIIRQMQGA